MLTAQTSIVLGLPSLSGQQPTPNPHQHICKCAPLPPTQRASGHFAVSCQGAVCSHHSPLVRHRGRVHKRECGAMSKPPARCALVSHGMSLTIGAQARVWHQCEAQSAQLSSAPKATTRSRRDEVIKTQSANAACLCVCTACRYMHRINGPADFT